MTFVGWAKALHRSFDRASAPHAFAHHLDAAKKMVGKGAKRRIKTATAVERLCPPYGILGGA
jgi:hypothetical protein